MNRQNARVYTDPAVGRPVRVIHSDRYGGVATGKTGTIRGVWTTESVAVDLFGMAHDTNRHGYFYFPMNELAFIDDTKNNNEREEKTMNKKENYINVAEVQFLDDSTAFRYIECANYEQDLKVGDVCVVMTNSHGMGLAEVVNIKPPVERDVLREIVSIVDMSRYNTRVERREEAAELKAKMKERAKQLQDIVLYQTLAKDDPEMAQMLADFLKLNTKED